MIGKRYFWVMVWIVASASALLVACGDDAGDGDGPRDSDSGPRDSGSDSPGGETDAATSGQTDSGSSTNTDSGTGSSTNRDASTSSDEDAGADEPCGAVVCEAPECCVDPFASLCGAQLGRACLMPPPPDVGSDPRCPSISIMGIFSLSSCCTDEGECGIDASMFGSGCVNYAEAEEGAANMGAGGFIPWPAQGTCD